MTLSDRDLLIKVRGEQRHLPRAEAVRIVAELAGRTTSGVSGQVTRAERDPQAMLALADYMARVAVPSQAERRALRIVEDSKGAIAPCPTDDYTAVYVSDIHFPQHEQPALSLFLDVLADLPNVQYISALNDALDFPRISQWPERRSIRAQQFDHDFSLTLDVYEQWLQAVSLAAPRAQHIAIVGNHDSRPALYGVDAGAAEVLQAVTMERLHSAGVLFLDLLRTENVWSPAPGVLWAHGFAAGINLKTVARKGYEHFKTIQRYDGDYTLITGHVHRPYDYAVPGGGRSIISGCFHQPHPHYLKTAPHWEYAFVITSVVGGNVFNDLVRIEYDKNGRLFCRYNSKVYK